MTLLRFFCLTTVLLHAGLAGRVVAATPEGPVVVATGNQYAPYADETLPGGGIATRIVTTVFAAAGIDTQIVYLPWARAYESTKLGAQAAVFPYLHTPERAQDFLYSAAITFVDNHIFAADPALAAAPLTALAGRRVCIALGYALPDLVRMMTEAGDLQVTARPQQASQCPRMILSGRADFWVQDRAVEAGLRRRENLPELNRSHLPVEVTTLHVLFPRRRPDSADLRDRFNAALSRLESDGTLSRIRDEVE
jgi:polar amino acid transport system substrate-binding protein